MVAFYCFTILCYYFYCFIFTHLCFPLATLTCSNIHSWYALADHNIKRAKAGLFSMPLSFLHNLPFEIP